MNSLNESIDNLESAYQAKDAAMERAIADVNRQYAPILLRRQTEYQTELRREAGHDKMDD